jgi:hypothetical protein
MQQATAEADITIPVMSEAYLKSQYTQPEWATAFAQDPQGKKRKLIPVRVESCQLTGLLTSIIYLDLVGLPENDARTALLGAFSIREKPVLAPTFPGMRRPPAPRLSLTQPAYPGATRSTSPSIADTLPTIVEGADQSRRLSGSKRLQFIQLLNAISTHQFNMLLFAVNPEPGLVPPMPAPRPRAASS